tara:strand:+ start:559 stop:864 length:306 start_codon:yes stop_codon:yes gene_type:complete
VPTEMVKVSCVDKTINLINMNRPNKKDYLTTNQFEYNQMLNKYYDALEAYIDILEKQLTLTDVSHQRELLVWLQKSDLITFPKDEINEVIDDYRFYQTNCS